MNTFSCILFVNLHHITYLLLTEFEVHTVSYGPGFFPLIYGPSAKSAGHKSTEKTRIRIKSTYSMDQENEVSKIYIYYISEVNQGRGRETSWSLAGSTVKYGLQNWPIRPHCYLHVQFLPPPPPPTKFSNRTIWLLEQLPRTIFKTTECTTL